MKGTHNENLKNSRNLMQNVDLLPDVTKQFWITVERKTSRPTLINLIPFSTSVQSFAETLIIRGISFSTFRDLSRSL